jgi:type IV pilus assembly protein PilB
MALARIQKGIVSHLQTMGRLSGEQAQKLIDAPGEMSGEAVEQLLSKEYGITPFQILVAKAKACDLAPFNARAFVIGPRTFEKLEKDFCREHKVLPVGLVGESGLTASNRTT